jgi:hypothetical protein
LVGLSEADAKEHYLTFGLLEGRTASTDFDPIEYLDLNPGLKAQFGADYRRAAYYWLKQQ